MRTTVLGRTLKTILTRHRLPSHDKLQERRDGELRTRAIYKLKDGLSAHDSKVLDTPIEKQLQQPIGKLQRWLNYTETFVRQRYRAHQERLIQRIER